MGARILVSGLSGRLGKKIAADYAESDYRIKVINGRTSMITAAMEESPNLVVLGSTGHNVDDELDQVRQLRDAHPKLPIILISKESNESRAVAAFRAGVSDYFKEPVSSGRLLKRTAVLLGDSKPLQEAKAPKPILSITHAPKMIGRSPAIQATRRYLKKVAVTSTTVLITGETGTGKELAARLIHFYSSRSRNPLISVNCAALPESLAESEMFGYERGAFTGAVTRQKGKFVQANHGTIFLDEIGDMAPFIQAKILHTIERKVVYPLGSRQALPLDVRIIAATNQDPETLMQEGRFRKDLFYRLNIARVNLLPLRYRREDIPGLVAYAISELNQRFNRKVAGLTPDAMDLFRSYAWPGNVRELMNLLEATFIDQTKDTIACDDLPAYFRDMIKNRQGCPSTERQDILSALLETNWNKSRAAKKLNWSRMTLYRKMDRYNIIAERKQSSFIPG